MKETLYRKYRPQEFSDVVGQEHVVSVLEESIKSDSLAHAYLFYGSRGIGKTSVARILAKQIGCVEEDLYEIDAASNRGIDDIRELRDSVATLPFRSPFKVYIIDEVHMLTKDAFNALLKTLEEPPQHVIFILATTEIHKVLDTVLSRCQVFTFARPDRNVLTTLLKETLKREKMSAEDGALELLAFLADGSFRDALGILQKVTSSSQGNVITKDYVESVTGAPQGVLVTNIVKGIVSNDKEAALKHIHTAVENSIDMGLLLELVVEHLRFALLVKAAPALQEELGKRLGKEEVESLVALSKGNPPLLNSKTLLTLLETFDYVGKSSVRELPLELAVLRVCGEEAS
jgi:DNA polymerase III subunit gamma/tau